MKTGICTTDFNTLPKPTADALFARIRKQGFECVQFAFESISETDFIANGQIEIPPVITDEMIMAVTEASFKYDLPVYVLNGTFNMAHPSMEVRKEGLRRLELLAQTAAKMQVPYISLCSGTANPEYLWSSSPENDTQPVWDRMQDTMEKAVAIAEKYDVVLAIEAESANVISTPERARRIMDTIGSRHLKMILDCANLFPHGAAFVENVQDTIAYAMEVYGRDVVIAHGKDIYDSRESLDFCGTGLGIVDFTFMAEQLRKYNYRGHMFLHGIYEEADMPRALEYWKTHAVK